MGGWVSSARLSFVTMTGIVYRNTKTTLPGWVNTVHVNQPRGVAYETDTHFVHLYGVGSGLYVISSGLTATEKKSGSLNDWAMRVFGAEDIRNSSQPVGSTVEGVWRPGLYYHAESLPALGNSEQAQRSCAQSVRLLLERLDELLMYIEPDSHGLNAYSHKTRELLILACTEVENTWKHYMRKAGVVPVNGKDFTTKDYVKLLSPLFLSEYEIIVKPYGSIPSLKPFDGWDPNAPTKSLAWYDAYNKTKHDRTNYFSVATLHHCLSSIAANLVLFSVRFSPFFLTEGSGTLAPLFNQLFTVQLDQFSPESSYIPKLKLPADMRGDLVCGNRKEFIQPWTVKPLSL